MRFRSPRGQVQVGAPNQQPRRQFLRSLVARSTARSVRAAERPRAAMSLSAVRLRRVVRSSLVSPSCKWACTSCSPSSRKSMPARTTRARPEIAATTIQPVARKTVRPAKGLSASRRYGQIRLGDERRTTVAWRIEAVGIDSPPACTASLVTWTLPRCLADLDCDELIACYQLGVRASVAELARGVMGREPTGFPIRLPGTGPERRGELPATAPAPCRPAAVTQPGG